MGEPTPINLQPLELKDFSGGMTDFYLGGPLHKFQQAENLFIVKYSDETGKLFTRPGSDIYDATYYQIPAGDQRINTLKYFESVLFYHSARKLYYVNAGWQTLQGPSSNDLFPSGVDTTTVVSLATWNKHLFITSSDLTQRVQKVYSDSGGTWRLRTAGMPALASSPVPTGGTPGTTKSYLYRFLYYYTYTVGTITYIDRGPTTEVTATNTTAIAVGAANTISWASIPALANSTTHNYDTASANLKVEIYRTTNGGSNFFYVSAVNNGTTTYADTLTDALLQDNEPLYTEGGAPDRDPPPLCKLVHVVGDRGFYAHTKEGTEVHTNRVYQSIPSDIDAVPATFYSDVDDEIVGMSSVQNTPIIMCLGGAIYRVDGFIDELGLGFLSPQKISATAGCVSSLSIVQTLEGVYWAGIDGFYFSDGYRVVRISTGIRNTYKSLISTATTKRRIYGKYDATNKRIYWAVQYASTATDNDYIFVLDLNFGVSEDMPFTTLAGGDNFNPTAIEFIGANLVRADKHGYTFLHGDTLYTDPKIDITTAPSTWNVAVITYDYLSCATDFGSSFSKKWVPSVSVVAKNETNLSLQIRSINDYGRRTADLKPIRFRGNLVWGDEDVYWGDPSLVWNYVGLVDETRRMAPQHIRCEYKQLQLTNALVAIVSSDLIGTVNVDAAAKTATLVNAATYDWPTASVDYYLSFASDSYVINYPVSVRAANVLTFIDASNTVANATAGGWVLRGYPKGEVLHLISLCMHYAVFGKTQTPYRASETGEVGA